MVAINERAIRRQRRILGRAVRRGEQPPTAIEEFERSHPEVFGVAAASPTPAGPPVGRLPPFVHPDGRPCDLAGLYQGGAVFVVLAGPSLLELDLTLLKRRGVVTFGMNNSPAIVRPNLWVSVDPPRKFHSGIWLDPHVLKFVPSRLMRRDLRSRNSDGTFSPLRVADDSSRVATPADCPAVVGYERSAWFDADKYLGEREICWGNSQKSARKNNGPRCLNSMLAVVKLCYVLGFRIVYLLGADFRMEPGRPYAFEQAKGDGGVASNNNGYAILNAMFHQLRPRFDKAGFRVFNCFESSGLTAFPFVPFSEAIRSATADVPQDPLVTAGWYGDS